MASFRTARVFAAVAALPLAAALFTSSASADDIADDGSNASVATIVGSGVGDDNSGNSTTTQQVATGAGASNQNNTASVNDSGFTVIDQSNESIAVNFFDLW